MSERKPVNLPPVGAGLICPHCYHPITPQEASASTVSGQPDEPGAVANVERLEAEVDRLKSKLAKIIDGCDELTLSVYHALREDT